MSVYFTPSGADPGPEELRWSEFWKTLKICESCGRMSYLHGVCPDCGADMKSAVPSQVRFYVLLNLLPALVLVVLQLWLQQMLRPFPALVRIAVTVLCIGFHAFMLLLIWRLWKKAQGHFSQIPPWEVGRFRWGKDRSSLDDLVGSWHFFGLARDAYYLDAAWLEQSAIALEAGREEQRDVLLGRSIWLSVICDTPRLALTRLRLLAKGKISDGFHTDLDEIMNQILPTPTHVAELLQTQPQMLETLCQCVMFDAVGISQPNRRNVCIALRQLMDDPAWSAGLTESERMLLRQTLVFCGPDQDHVCGAVSEGGGLS